MPELRCVLGVRAKLGECPVWSTRDRALYWVDIDAPSLNRFDPATGENFVMPMPESIGSFALRKPAGFIVALRSGIWLADSGGSLERRILAAPYDPAHHRFNDGRCDPAGRFFVGYMNEKRDANSAALMRIDPDGRMTEVFSDIMISNGLAWSPDGRTMYHADTPTHTVRAFDYDVSAGAPSRPRVFVQWRGETDRPDGCAIDSEGNYWSAFFRGGKVVKVSPSGRTIAEYPVPAMCPTMCAFGGPDLRTLFVTTARGNREAAELARLPYSGGIFAMTVDVPGLPEPSFAG
ncbi:MAG TPA: SMP-30/gluconolactonase/LRE family protein [Casimicrobiaceae bacterium]|nr:SMP-30/gluconolactonase/LRE family protein [Casimicrobiaceae bacterium]